MGLVFWVYRHGLIALPRGDHFSFLKEWILLQSDGTFFLRVLSFNQTRLVDPGDYFLFRPAATGLLALTEIAFRHHYGAAGALSIALHGLASFVLYRILGRLTLARIAWPVALLFSVQYPGMEMVMWRHISPYIGGLIFFGLGQLMLCRALQHSNTGPFPALAALFFLLSALFHETALAASAALASLAVFSRKDKGRSVLLKACLTPVLAYAGIYALNQSLHGWPAVFHGEAPGNAIAANLPALSVLPFFAGLATLAWILPEAVRIQMPYRWERAVMDFSSLPESGVRAAGIAVSFVILGLLLFSAGRLLRGKKAPEAGVSFLSGTYLLFLFAGVAFGRLSSRGLHYLSISSYYFYMTSYSLWILAFSLVPWIPERLRTLKAMRALGGLLVMALVLVLLPPSYRGILNVLGPDDTFERRTGAIVREITKAVEARPGSCYGGALDPTISVLAPRVLFYRHVCQGGGSPLYISLNGTPGDSVALVRFPGVTTTPVQLEENELYEEGKGRILLSRGVYDPVLFQARVHAPRHGGIVFPHTHAGEFILFTVENGLLRLGVIASGRLSQEIPLFEDMIYEEISRVLLLKDSVMLAVRKIPGGYGLFADDNFLGELKGLESIRGRMGLFHGPESGTEQTFSEVLVSERQLGGAEAGRVETVEILPFRRTETGEIK
jgi:hypothetical protein